ncbi:MAG: NAD(P)-dependent oxidoreductase [Lachnospiraceae bacterium]|nr:NAD(P)-dependent oxidoreductase [Lachnospiraceae bacterium]
MIIVIGATSFIGVHTVVELVRQGEKVLVTGRNNRFRGFYESLGVSYINLDLMNPEDFEKLPKNAIEGVILLAGLLPANAPVNLDKDENAADYFKINTIGTINCLEYCRKNSIKRVISTCSYGDVRKAWNGTRRLTEDEPRNFYFTGDHSVYTISKNAANDVMEYYNQQHGMKNAVFRFPTVFGVTPHMSLYVNGEMKKSGFQIFIEKALNAEDITVYGDAQMIRDVAYVKDVAHAFYLAIKNENTYGLYNMTAGGGVTLQEQAEVMRDIFHPNDDRRSKIIYRPDIPNNTTSYLFSMEKAKRDFGFEPQFKTFRDMMIDFKKDWDNELYKDLFKY